MKGECREEGRTRAREKSEVMMLVVRVVLCGRVGAAGLGVVAV